MTSRTKSAARTMAFTLNCGAPLRGAARSSSSSACCRAFHGRDIFRLHRRARDREVRVRRLGAVMKAEDRLDELRRRVADYYSELQPAQQLYVQSLYLTLVVSVLVSIAGGMVRIYML